MSAWSFWASDRDEELRPADLSMSTPSVDEAVDKGVFWGGRGVQVRTLGIRKAGPKNRTEEVTIQVRNRQDACSFPLLIPSGWICCRRAGKRSRSWHRAGKATLSRPSFASSGCAGDAAGASCHFSRGVHTHTPPFLPPVCEAQPVNSEGGGEAHSCLGDAVEGSLKTHTPLNGGLGGAAVRPLQHSKTCS